MSILAIIKQVQAAKGKNAKRDILMENRDNVALRMFMGLVYEPTFSYYMTDLPEGTKANTFLAEAYQHQKIIDLTTKLRERHVTGFAAKQYVAQVCAMTDSDTVELIRYILLRSIKAGIGESTIEQVWPNLITLVPYQRCVLPKDSNIKNWKWGEDGFYAISQIKADGMYANINVKADGSFQVQSRAGSVFPYGGWFTSLKSNAIALVDKLQGTEVAGVTGTQIQGEMLVLKNGVVQPRAIGNGLLNSILQTGEELGPEYVVSFVVWDAIPLEKAVYKGRFEVKYKKRWACVREAVTAVTHASAGSYWSGTIELIESKEVFSFVEAAEHFQSALRRNLEGTVLKHMDAIWLDGDNPDQIKGKIEFVVELVLAGFNAGDQNGRNKDTFGSLAMETQDGLLKVGVTGISDKLRADLNARSHSALGSIWSVRANDIMYSTDGGKTPHSLFLPRLVEERLDKREADSFQRVVDQLEAAKKGMTL